MIKVEKLEGEAGATITFDEVLMVGDEGSRRSAPRWSPAPAVTAEVIAQDGGDKIIVFKKRAGRTTAARTATVST